MKKTTLVLGTVALVSGSFSYMAWKEGRLSSRTSPTQSFISPLRHDDYVERPLPQRAKKVYKNALKNELKKITKRSNKKLKKKISKVSKAKQGPQILKSKVFTPKVKALAPRPQGISSNIMNSPYVGWALTKKNNNAVPVLKAWKNFNFKKNVKVAVIDTGIDNNHPFLKGNIIKVGNGYGRDFSKSPKSAYAPFDTHGHGTHVSGIIKSIFPKVKLLALKYYSLKASGLENLNSTIDALRYAVDQNVDIINFSGGGAEPSLEELKILKEAERKGILVVAAAGNEESNIDSKNHSYYPASYGLSNIISVTAHDRNLKILPSSNYGHKTVNIVAPGKDIRSSLPHAKAGMLTGTSQATAFVSGAAALLKSMYPYLTAVEIKKILELSAKKESSFVGKANTGGRLDVEKALTLATKYDEKRPKRRLAQKTTTGRRERMAN